MFKLKHLGTGVLFFAPIIAFSSESIGVNVSRLVTQSNKSNSLTMHVINNSLDNKYIIEENLKFPSNVKKIFTSQSIPLENIKIYTKPIIDVISLKNNKKFDFNFPEEIFESTLDFLKNLNFLSYQCALFDQDELLHKDLETLLVTYHYLNELEKNKNDLSKINVDYFLNNQSINIVQKYLNKSLTENHKHVDCSTIDTNYYIQSIRNTILKNMIEFERVESILANRSLNVKHKNIPLTHQIINSFDLDKIAITPYKYETLIESLINVKYCSWEAKDVLKIEQLLKESSKTAIAFGESIFRENWKERKAFNYIYTYRSYVKYNLSNHSKHFCEGNKLNLEQLNLSYRKHLL